MKSFIRTWQKQDIKDIEKHLIIVGELSSECNHCHEIGIDLHARACPGCGAMFKYMGFRRKLSQAHLQKASEANPRITLIDFEDFKRSIGKRDARNILDI